MILETPRTRLRSWQPGDAPAFAAMNADPEVMRDLGGAIARADSDAKLGRYRASFDRDGIGRWVIESREGEFLGYAGVMFHRDHPIGAHYDAAWRLVRQAWGCGYATEAALAALRDAFTRIGMAEVLAYTAADNLRSQKVMARLRLRRDPLRDFTAKYGANDWNGLVWVARSELFA